jgi:hypothetical protein
MSMPTKMSTGSLADENEKAWRTAFGGLPSEK